MTAWDAIERAGIAPGALFGQDAGVFAGYAGDDYGPPWQLAPSEFEGGLLAGTAPSLVSARIPFFFGAHVGDLHIDGREIFGTRRRRPGEVSELPTYPFQARRRWPADSTPASAYLEPGLDLTGHPWLSLALPVGDTGGWVLGGSLSAASSPWLAGRTVQGHAVIPGAALAEMVLRAAAVVGCGSVSELTQYRPLIVSRAGTIRLQISVGSPGPDGERPVSCFSHPEKAASEVPWTRHAEGLIAAGSGDSAGYDLGDWPPARAERADIEALCARLHENGTGYGAEFRAVTAAWQRDGTLYAEITLPEELRADSSRFGLHPVLLGAALHVAGLARPADSGGVPLVPFAWADVRLLSAGATGLRIRLEPVAAGAYSVFATDPVGRPVLSAASVALRRASGLAAADTGAPLPSLCLPVWRPIALTSEHRRTCVFIGYPGTIPPISYSGMDDLRAAIRSGAAVPDTVIVRVARGGGGEHSPVHQVLAALQSWLREELTACRRLAVLTRGAVAALPGEAPDPALAAVWGLVRFAQQEHPGQLVLIDTDEAPASLHAVRAATVGDEPQVAIRAGVAMVAGLAQGRAGRGTRALSAGGTVLLTGGTGTLGRVLARHLVMKHGVRHLVLASRRGPEAPGAADLAAALTAMGAAVSVVPCDVSQREEVAALLAGIPTQHPLTAVVHAAAALDDGLIGTLTSDQVSRAMSTTADAARHLDELTSDHDLAAFVMFSSCAATFGGVGQGNYAAANAYLEALAQRRQARALPATALAAWGLWAHRSELTAGAETDRLGELAPGVPIAAMSTKECLAVFDATWLSDQPVFVPVRLASTAPGQPTASVLRDLRLRGEGRAGPRLGESGTEDPRDLNRDSSSEAGASIVASCWI
jgi:acyl transferase domain-containing protein